jgi:O6-methylguanine-DNA--protein-cysteine methyltransferase
MARKSATSRPPISPSQAAYVLDQLVKDGRISQRDVRGALNSMNDEIRALEERLEALRAAGSARAADGATPRRRGSARRAAAAPRRRRRSARISESQRRSRVLQGQYLSLIRRIPAGERGKYKKIAEANGREAAIQQMRTKLGA